MSTRAEPLRETCARYLGRCNEHDVEALREFVAPDVRGPESGWDGYARDVRAALDAFPDLRWEVQQLVVEGPWLAARPLDTGTHTGTYRGTTATGRRITVQELVLYRWEHGRVVECWGDQTSALQAALLAPS